MAPRKLFLLVIVLGACSRVGFNGPDAARARGDGPPRATDSSRETREAQPAVPASRIYGGSDDPTWRDVGSFSSTAARSGAVQLIEQPGLAVKSAKLGSVRAWASAARQGETIYLFGGGTQAGTLNGTKEVWAYRPGSDSLSVAGSLPQQLVGSQAVATKDGAISVLMGIEPTLNKSWEERVLAFSPLSGQTVEVAGGLYGAYHHAAAVASNGTIYAFGGYGSGPLQSTVQGYDPVTRKVLPAAALLPSARDKLAAFTAPNGNIYIFGGALVHADDPAQGSSLTDEILRFTPPSSLKPVAAKLPVPLINMAGGTLPDGYIYLLGGDASTISPPNTIPTVYVLRFDPSTETLDVLGQKLPQPLSGAAFAVGDNGKLYLFGGRTLSGLGSQILELHPFVLSGEVFSSVIDTGADRTPWLSLEVQASVPAGTTVTLWARGADTAFDLLASKPDWQPLEGLQVKTGLPSGRYLEWRATLKTSNTAVTPSLTQVTMQCGSP